MPKRIGGEPKGVPLIHRSMSVEVARSLVYELETFADENVTTATFQQQCPETWALIQDLKDILRQLESGDVKRPC